MSTASTGFAQSPANPWTVTARPTIRASRQTGTIPAIAPFLCMASEMLGVDTDERISRTALSGDGLSPLVRAGPSRAARTARADAATSADLVTALPTITMSAPAAAACGAVAASRPPAAARGTDIPLRISESTSRGLFPLICWSMPTWALTMCTPIRSSSLALATGSGTLIRSPISLTP